MLVRLSDSKKAGALSACLLPALEKSGNIGLGQVQYGFLASVIIVSKCLHNCLKMTAYNQHMQYLTWWQCDEYKKNHD